ncbi:hypothetical protein KIW84_055345 [Lathyrus oleraceus]|uniref:Uncharacterized protein n=1 Tax=Pisum sativum TaxID=3888 RepID=A0A9D5AJT8_PEA|nr:hypothetical protein KIW84_055345 [Pisum sativum]
MPELARLFKQEEKVIQSHEGAMQDHYSKHRGYARVGYRCRCAQATVERRLSSREAKRQCLYQRAMVTLFHDMIHHEIECYVDDMIAKSQTGVGHLVEIIQTEAARRLRQFMLVHTTLWISEMGPIEYGFENPALTGRVARRAKEC